MTDPNVDPPQPHAHREQEYNDPHYHDDDLEIPVDDRGQTGDHRPMKNKIMRRPPPRRRYIED